MGTFRKFKTDRRSATITAQVGVERSAGFIGDESLGWAFRDQGGAVTAPSKRPASSTRRVRSARFYHPKRRHHDSSKAYVAITPDGRLRLARDLSPTTRCHRRMHLYLRDIHKPGCTRVPMSVRVRRTRQRMINHPALQATERLNNHETTRFNEQAGQSRGRGAMRPPAGRGTRVGMIS